jgi:hypothetical protein
MKFSIAFSFLILIIAASFGWQRQQRLTVVRDGHTKLVANAEQLGVVLDPADPSKLLRGTKRDRGNREADAKTAAAELIALTKEMEAMKEDPNIETQKRMLELMDRIMSMDATQLKTTIAEFRAASDLTDRSRKSLVGFSIVSLASDQPQAALALYSEVADLFKDGGMGKQILASSLASWVKNDPAAALAWAKQNGTQYPDLASAKARRGLIAGAATQDPKLALKLIGDLDFEDPARAAREVAEAAKTPEQRTASLAALREHIAEIQDEAIRKKTTNEAIREYGSQAVDQGFELGSKWLNDSNLSTTELGSIIDGIDYNHMKEGEVAQWITWVGQKLPADQGQNKIRNLVKDWSKKDYAAAGKWLATTPEGPTKYAAVRSYAETVSKYEPAAAAQWALTLPSGQDRDNTLEEIYRNWPKKDEASKAAAEAFAKQYGIK